MIASDVTLLPDPLSPTSPSVSPRSDRERHPVDDADRYPPAVAELDRQVGDLEERVARPLGRSRALHRDPRA